MCVRRALGGKIPEIGALLCAAPIIASMGGEVLPSVIFASVGIGYAQVHIDRDPESVENPADVCRVLLIHNTWLVPDHLLSEVFDEFADLGPPELLRDDEVGEVIGSTEEGLLGGQAEVP